MKAFRKNVDAADATAAILVPQRELQKIRTGADARADASDALDTFRAFAASLFEANVKTGEIKAASGRTKSHTPVTHEWTARWTASLCELGGSCGANRLPWG